MLGVSKTTLRQHDSVCRVSLGANEQHATPVCVEGGQVQLPATHRRGILQGKNSQPKLMPLRSHNKLIDIAT
jgi:hypothetical protein